jgi:hypothetical protein
VNGSHPDRRSTADRRQLERRRVIALQPTQNVLRGEIIRPPHERRLANRPISNRMEKSASEMPEAQASMSAKRAPAPEGELDHGGRQTACEIVPSGTVERKTRS